MVSKRLIARLPDYLCPGDLLIVNDSKVFPARLLGTRVPSGGAVECLLLSSLDDQGRWDALVHPGQSLRPGSRMAFGGTSHVLHGEILEEHFYGRRTVRLWTDDGTRVEMRSMPSDTSRCRRTSSATTT